jgi:HK97 family phage prohead protease
MPWRVVPNHPSCPPSKPFGVINKQTGQLERGGCHETRDLANRQLAALYAKEPTMGQRSNLLFGAEWKAVGGDSGELEGYVSVFGNRDKGGDVVLPGAFKKTLADWSRAKQPLPLIADHNLTTDGVIGSVVQAKEDQVGLWVRARFSSDPKAQSVRMKMLEGHIKGMSFTYDAIKHYFGQQAGKSVRFLQELKLFEATVTPFPMNDFTLATAKTNDLDAGLDLDAFSDAMRPVLEIPYGRARKAALEVLLADYNPNDIAADPADEQITADAAADTGTVESDPAAYAAGFLARLSGPRDGAPDGKPPEALADPRIPLEVARQDAEADRLEAEISRALGRAT